MQLCTTMKILLKVTIIVIGEDYENDAILCFPYKPTIFVLYLSLIRSTFTAITN